MYEYLKGIITKMLNTSTNSSKLILGIDPGERIGVSVTYLENEIARKIGKKNILEIQNG